MAIKDVMDILEIYKKRKTERGLSEKFKNKKEDIIKQMDSIIDMKFIKSGKEIYVFRGNDELKCTIETTQKIDHLILDFFLEDRKKLEIHSKNTGKDNNHFFGEIELGPLYLDAGRYSINIRNGKEKLIENLKIAIVGSEKKMGDHILMKDPGNNDNFPNGKYYGFGNVDQIIEKYESGKSIYIYTDYIDGTKIKEVFDEASIIKEGVCDEI